VVDIHRHQSHAELLTYLQAKQVNGPIHRLDCYVQVQHDKFNIQLPLFAFIVSTPMLEHVTFSGLSGRASINAFLGAVIQNDSIHTVQLISIDCSTHVVQKLMERKR